MNGQDNRANTPNAWWNLPVAEVLQRLGSNSSGLTNAAAEQLLKIAGPNSLKAATLAKPLALLARQFKSPLVLILIAAAGISLFIGEYVDASIMLSIVVASALLGFWQEYNAGNAMERLRQRVTLKSKVLRDGVEQEIPADQLAPGDVVLLAAGSLIPADGLLFSANDFFVNQAVLTGETYPVEKEPGIVPVTATLLERTNMLFMGTNVRSGFGKMVITETGKNTAYGQIAERLNLKPEETAFERGIRRFGAMLTQVMTLLVLIVFAINVLLHKPAVDALLFAVALAVGIAPELLPAIISITLSRGAMQMAKRGVIVRQLEALENFGSMDVLCTDKTGTLTLGAVRLDGALGPDGQPSEAVMTAAWLNASLQTGLPNALDEAILQGAPPDTRFFNKTEEIPYDFIRKRLSVAVSDRRLPAADNLLITKGAFENMLDVCAYVRTGAQERTPLDEPARAALLEKYTGYGQKGFRVLGVASKTVPAQDVYPVEAEADMDFLGFLLFFDPPKPGADEAIRALRRMGVELKIITGDNREVALHVAEQVGLKVRGVLRGKEIQQLNDEALWHLAARTTLFTEVDPNQKEKIIRALQKTGHVVGYMGDGINDAPALHAADVGISVENAVDVAKESADFVLLEQNLDVLRVGIEQGRHTFANTLKYVFTTTSANFGNMLSMAGLSVFIPFLPLLPKQILLNNFMSDFPAMTIANDAVDPEYIARPRRWNVTFIRNFMIVFGLISSCFDYLTFAVLLWWMRVSEDTFRTAWFIESLLTELVILLIVRTRRPLWKSLPGRWLWLSSLLVAIAAMLMPYQPWVAGLFGFVPLPPALLGTLVGITLLYAAVNEGAKGWFFRKYPV